MRSATKLEGIAAVVLTVIAVAAKKTAPLLHPATASSITNCQRGTLVLYGKAEVARCC